MILRRLVNDTIKDDPDGKWLQEGIKKVLEFGENSFAENIQLKFRRKVEDLFDEKGIVYHV